MRLASLLPALTVAFAVQGPAQSPSSLPPTVQSQQGLLSAPATSTTPGTPATSAGVTTVNTSAQVTSSTSATKQFIVYGADLQTRSTFCLLCEDTAIDLGRLLKDDGRFALPIVVVLKTPPNINLSEPVITTSFSQLAYGGFHLQINVELRKEFNTEDFSKELVRMLLAERILRNHKEVQTTRSQLLSGWLLTGVTQAMEFRSRSRPSALFAAVFRSGQVYSIDRIIEANPKELDALARGIYETSSCALVLALLDQVDGSARFSRFLSGLANGKKGDRELLKEHFPTLGVSKNSLEKWWTLQMASLATPSTFEAMNYLQTEEALEPALTFRVPEQHSNSGTKSAAGAPTEALPSTTETQPEKKSRSWFRFGRKDKEEESGTEPGKEEAATPTQPAPAPAPASTPAASPAATPAPANTPATPPQAEAPKKRGFFNFSGGRKIAAPIRPKPENVDGEPAASTKPPTAAAPAAKPPGNATAPTTTPAAAAAPAEETKKPRGFRGIFGRKKEEPAPAAAPAPAPTPAPAEANKPSTTARRAQTKKPPAETVEKPAAKPEAAAKSDEKKDDADKPKDAPKEEVAPAIVPVDPEFVGPPAPVKEEPGKPAGEMPAPLPGLAMPTNAGERRPDEPLPPGLSPVPPAPGDPQMAAPGMGFPLPLLTDDPTPPPPDVSMDTGSPLPLPGTRPSDPNLLPLEDFAKLGKRKDRNEIFKRTLNQINSVKLRAHPLYRPLIGEYTDVIQSLILGRETGVAEQLAAIRKRHLEVRELARAVETYVDWYKADQTQTYSGAFDDYMKLRDDLDKQTIPRTDAVSRYLDAIQQEFEE
ncbi:hypothetical protein [Verrucomicrobium sp. BvORR106]|uniref:hypothetical protein n=1 Tax=Verrucomicrobium sp. BvORR106 TaxID=1403819 RepID=UPI00056DA1F7|nr:hypothetical protein [Verrucomicrobium sp. BvORR106]